MLTDE